MGLVNILRYCPNKQVVYQRKKIKFTLKVEIFQILTPFICLQMGHRTEYCWNKMNTCLLALHRLAKRDNIIYSTFIIRAD